MAKTAKDSEHYPAVQAFLKRKGYVCASKSRKRSLGRAIETACRRR